MEDIDRINCVLKNEYKEKDEKILLTVVQKKTNNKKEDDENDNKIPK